MRPVVTSLVLLFGVVLPTSANASSGLPYRLIDIAKKATWIGSGVVVEAREDGSFAVPLDLAIVGTPPERYVSPLIPKRIDTQRPSVGTALVVFEIDRQVRYRKCTSPTNVARALRAIPLMPHLSLDELLKLLQDLLAAGDVDSLEAAMAGVSQLEKSPDHLRALWVPLLEAARRDRPAFHTLRPILRLVMMKARDLEMATDLVSLLENPPTSLEQSDLFLFARELSHYLVSPQEPSPFPKTTFPLSVQPSRNEPKKLEAKVKEWTAWFRRNKANIRFREK